MPAYKKISPSTGRASWYVSFYYTDWTGKKKQKKKEGFDKRTTALEYERAFLERQAAAPDMTFAALCDLFLDDYKATRRATSYETASYYIAKYAKPFFSDMPINTITPAAVRKWQAEIRGKGNLAPVTLGNIHVYLSSVFNFAVKYYGLPRNPARIAGSMGTKKPKEMQFWTLSQFKAFQKASSPSDIENIAITLLFYTGMRRGELLALTPADFDFEAGLLSISKNYQRINGRDIIQPPKTEKGKRKIALPPFIVSMMKDCLRRLNNPRNNQRIFETVTRFTLKNALDKGAKGAGLPIIRVHDLRHSHASLLIEQGFSPIVIKERLGHENIETTLNTYSHLYPTKQSEIAARLETLSQE